MANFTRQYNAYKKAHNIPASDPLDEQDREKCTEWLWKKAWDFKQENEIFTICDKWVEPFLQYIEKED